MTAGATDTSDLTATSGELFGPFTRATGRGYYYVPCSACARMSRTSSATRRRSIPTGGSNGVQVPDHRGVRRFHRLDVADVPDRPVASPSSSSTRQAPPTRHTTPRKVWVDKIHAMHLFDDGYEKLRERIFANQTKLGLVPQISERTPWRGAPC